LQLLNVESCGANMAIVVDENVSAVMVDMVVVDYKLDLMCQQCGQIPKCHFHKHFWWDVLRESKLSCWSSCCMWEVVVLILLQWLL
jgi:hypothetical protein